MSDKSTSRNTTYRLNPLFPYVRATQLERTYPEDAGAHIVSAMRVFAGWGAVQESENPYQYTEGEWPPVERPGLDDIARHDRSPYYVRVRSLEESIAALSGKFPFCAAFPTTGAWDDAPNGKIAVPGDMAEFLDGGSHCVLIAGYNDERRHFIFVNSWGKDWGDDGIGYLPYEYFDRFVQEAWMNERGYDLCQDSHYASAAGRPVMRWAMSTPLGILHGVEYYEAETDTKCGWAYARENGAFLDIEEVFVRPDRRGYGIGRELCQVLKEIVVDTQTVPRLWVPPIDDELGPGAVESVARMLHLELHPSPVTIVDRVGLRPGVRERLGWDTLPSATHPCHVSRRSLRPGRWRGVI